MKEISFGKSVLPRGWKVYRKDNGKYVGQYESPNPFSDTDEYEDRFALRRHIIDNQDLKVQEYLKQLDLRFKSVYLPVLTMNLMAFYSSDVENISYLRHKDKQFQSLLKSSMNNYLTIVEAECKQFGIYDMVDFLSEKFNECIFPLTEEALNALNKRLELESNKEDISRVIIVNILSQTIVCRNDLFKLRNDKSLKDITWSSSKLMTALFTGTYVVDLNNMDIYPTVSKIVEAMNKFDLSGYMAEYNNLKR